MTLPAARQRIPALDALRGAALVGMFAFHLTWDLGFFRLIPEDFPYSAPVMNFGHVVAITFLALAGASLVLATRDGVDWRAFGRRFAMIAGAAAAITLGTLYLFPDAFIFFGILHCIAVSSLLALAFLRAPPWLALVVAALMAVAPVVVALPALDNLFGWSLGLSAHPPRTNDWRPLLPWGGAVLAGLGLMRLALARGLPAWLANWRADSTWSRGLVWGGRHSMLVYLTHQPVFLAVVWLAAMAIGPQEASPLPEELQFQESCVSACATASANAPACTALCGCVADGARAAGLWRPRMDNRLTPVQRQTIDGLTRTCAPQRQ